MTIKKESLCAWLVLVFAFLTSIITFAINGRNYVNSDMASELVLADLLNKERGLLTGNWLYSTELRVFSGIPIIQIALLLFQDWHLARTISTAVMLAILLGSYLYLMHVLSLRSMGIWTAVALALPFSYDYMYYVLYYGGGYLPFLAVSFFIIGTAIRENKSKGVSVAAMALAFFSGLGGVRQALILFVPYWLTTFLFVIPELRNRMSKELLMKKSTKDFLYATTLFVCNLLGLLIESLILSRMFTYIRYENNPLKPFALSEYVNYLGNGVRVFGYRGVYSISAGGEAVVAISSIILCFILVFGMCFGVLHRKELTTKSRELMHFFFTSYLLTALIFYLGGQAEDRMILPVVLFAIPLFACIVEDLFPLHSTGRILVIGMLMFCLFLQSYKLFFAAARVERGLVRDELQQLADTLVEKEYSEGFATFWNADVLTERSSGALELWVVETDEFQTEFTQYQQKKSHLSELPDGKVFRVYESESVDIDEVEEIIFLGDKLVAVGYDSAKKAIDPK